MRTFSELLRDYIERTGVSDAELARAVGVQRQTIFRWKEGQVGRPRSAEDVLHLAAKLRLTPEERDELLLAAGFPPVAARVPGSPIPLAPAAEVEPEAEAAIAKPAHAESATADPVPADPGPAFDITRPPAAVTTRARSPRRRVWALAMVGALLLLGAAALVVLARFPRAANGETLVVVAQFGNYTGGAQGYNVAGRLSEALERELSAAGLRGVRVAAWPSALTGQAAASRALRWSGAALMIWGEYDSGRIVARLLPRQDLVSLAPELSLTAATPADLPAVVNSTLPGDIRYLALYSLAQIYLDAKEPAPARAALTQAGQNLPADPSTRTAHYFFLGYADQISRPPDLDAAIAAYTEALKLDDGLDAAHDNRAIAYLRRRGPGDLAAAVEDLTKYMAHYGDDAAAYNNRGSAYFLLGGPQNTASAVADFDKAIALAPQDPVGYYNRGLAYVRLDNPRWRADLQRALDGGNGGAREALCWAYSLSDEPGQAVAHCQEAIRAGLGPGPWENLGVAYARAGKYGEAADALAKYQGEMSKAGGGLPAARQVEIGAWVAALRAGKNPFDAPTLQRLREE